MFNGLTKVKCPPKEITGRYGNLFDPLQFLAPFTVRAKVLMQEIWMADVDWDEVLPDHLLDRWKKWLLELPQLSSVAVFHYLRLSNAVSYTSFNTLLRCLLSLAISG